MSDSFRLTTGRKVVSRASARELGAVDHLVLDLGQGRIAAIIVGRGKKARLVDWDALSVGPDAVMVSDEGALRPPADNRERAAADGDLDLIGRRALTEGGNELGTVNDVIFDTDTGTVEHLRIGDREIAAGLLLGSGSYAAVLDASLDAVDERTA